MKHQLLIFSLLLLNFSCSGQKKEESVSVNSVAEYFLIEDIYINSYIVADKDLEELYQDQKEWVKKYFPEILKQYDLTLYSQYSLAIYLHLESEGSYLKKLWERDKRVRSNEEFKYIINLLDLHEIRLE